MSKSPKTHTTSQARRPGSARKPPRSGKTVLRGAISRKANKPPRDGTKQAILIGLLQRPGGTTIAQMAAKTGWQTHSVRGFLAGTVKKRLGLPLQAEGPSDGPRRYRIPAPKGQS